MNVNIQKVQKILKKNQKIKNNVNANYVKKHQRKLKYEIQIKNLN